MSKKKLDWKDPDCRAWGPGPYPILPIGAGVMCPIRGKGLIAGTPLSCTHINNGGRCKFYAGIKGIGVTGRTRHYQSVFCLHPNQPQVLKAFYEREGLPIDDPKPEPVRLVEPEIPEELKEEKKEEPPAPNGQLSLF